MDPQTEKEVVESIDDIHTAIEALHEVSVEILMNLKEMNKSLKRMDNNIVSFTAKRPI